MKARCLYWLSSSLATSFAATACSYFTASSARSGKPGIVNFDSRLADSQPETRAFASLYLSAVAATAKAFTSLQSPARGHSGCSVCSKALD